MEHTNFDKIIKEKLQELEGVDTPNDWDVFEQLYDDALVGDEASFDRNIAEKFNKYDIPYDSSHWAIMKERLEREEYLITSVYFSKVAEAAIIFLLLFTFLNIYPENQPQKERSYFAEVLDSSANASEDVNNDNITSKVDLFIASNDIHNTLSSHTRVADLSKLTYQNSRINQVTKFILPVKNLISLSTFEKGLLAENIPTRREIITPAEVPFIDNSILEKDKMDIYRAYAVTRSMSDNGQKGESYISASFSPTVNLINSPSDYITNTAAYNTDAIGYETGMSYSFKKNNFEIESGLSYSNKSYKTQKNLNINMGMASIPIKLNYHFLSGPDFSLYASAGSSFNFITHTPDPNDDFNSGDKNRNFADLRSSGIPYKPGILQGGKFHNNLFMTLDISIGLETKLGETISLFLAPTLKQHIGFAGIGPYDDHLHSLGLIMGLKKRI